MDYSPFLDRLQQQNGSQAPFQLDLSLSEPPNLHSPTGEPLQDGPLSAQSSIGPSFAEAFNSPHVEMASPLSGRAFSGNPFRDHNQPRASPLATQRPVPLSAFTFSSQAASPVEREVSTGPLSSDPMAAMSLDPLDPTRRQRGHRRAQSDFFQYPQGFLEQEEANDLEHHHETPAEAIDQNQSRQLDLLEHMNGHIDVEELQNLLKSRSEENLSLDPKKAKRCVTGLLEEPQP